MRIRKVILPILLVMVLALVPSLPALGATSQNVTVTATPAFIAIANTPNTWLINGITLSGVIVNDTTYYSNPLGDTTTPSDPVVDGECRFLIANTSTIVTDLTVNFPHHTGGDASNNSDNGSNGGAFFGANSYFSGENYSTQATIAKNAASDLAYEDLAASTNISWGLDYESQITAWTSGDNMTSTVTIAATAA